MNIATFYQHVGQKRYVVWILGHEPHIASNFQHDTVHTKEDIWLSVIWPFFGVFKSDTLILKLLIWGLGIWGLGIWGLGIWGLGSEDLGIGDFRLDFELI